MMFTKFDSDQFLTRFGVISKTMKDYRIFIVIHECVEYKVISAK